MLGPQLRSNQVQLENLMSSRSVIEDTDFAVETSNLTRSQILMASGAKVLQIAQQQASHVLDLLA